MALALFYGGTFDPVHAGHLAVATAARAALGADVAFLPAADPPHRAAPGASAEQRARMLELAVAGEPGFSVDRRELHRDGPSWTVDTLRGLRAERGSDAPLAWLVGADAFRGLATWHQWRMLFDLAHFVVAVRPGHGLEALPPELAQACSGRWLDRPGALAKRPAGGLFRLDMPLHPASATELRRRLRAGEPHGGWLSAAVAAFIEREGLYRGGPAPAGV
jgi:nicotinate-nucleotide adenylyltransferase